jgi:hypothetical protein
MRIANHSFITSSLDYVTLNGGAADELETANIWKEAAAA